MGTSNHRADVIKITELMKHPNADSLSLVHVGGYQVVVRTENYRIGDLAIYIQPDSVVPDLPQFAWIWEKDGAGNLRTFDGPVPEAYRRVTVRKFRKQISEGLLVPLQDFLELLAYIQPDVYEGMDVAPFLGITHWEPKEDADTTGENESAPRGQSKIFPRSLKGWAYFLVHIFTFGLYGAQTGGLNEIQPNGSHPVYDVENYKNFVGAILPGEEVWVTEKIHGSNARYLAELIRRWGRNTYKLFAGSRRLWKSPYAQSSIWRKLLTAQPEVVTWCRLHPGYTIYGEVVPTQKGYTYGATSERPRLFIFDIRTPDGRWVERGTDEYRDLNTAEFLDRYWVPTLYVGPFDEEKIKKLADGQSTVAGANHLREGVVVRPVKEMEGSDRGIRGLGRVQLKIVSNKFLEMDCQI